MVVSRAISTVLDVSLALLLVSAAVVALVTIPGGDRRPPDPDAAARTVLASTATATYGPPEDRRSVSGRVSTLVGQAAVAADRGTDPAFVDAVEGAVHYVLVRTDGNVELFARAGDSTVRVGPRPPVSASVAAVTHEVDLRNTTATVTVRTWSR
ncbi:hypothetical protein HALDL1_05540 [Halobacterium sp. DL1]|nr:hypothetical protein HALDL1_05540 [Halobacterium sp. DL1]